MKMLTELLDGLEVLDASTADLDMEIRGISDDTRELRQGDAFVAVAGAQSDGHEFARRAAIGGAVVVLAERPIRDLTVPVVAVRDLKRLRSVIAGRLFDSPSRDLCCVGVTGTNGKTSIACFVAELAMRLGGQNAGFMGTIGWGVPGQLQPSNLTTESAITIQRRLAEFRKQGCRWVVLEASSHALDQHRVDGVAFDYAVFSNLSRDHLDYHDDFAGYGDAKARLFRFPDLKAAVINLDDAFGTSLVDLVCESADVITYGENPDADIRWDRLLYRPEGIQCQLRTPWGATSLELPLYGAFSVANASATLAVLCHAGFDLSAVVAALGSLSPVPGRMEFFPGAPTIVVDYAHTPDALEKMLGALRPHVTGQLICVCGCGGDRDRGKRPLMAQAACEHADRVWLTSDNPRNEDPMAIIDDMKAGVPPQADVAVEVDRANAIRTAFLSGATEDLVVVAGKGHEDYQEVNGRRIAFSDREMAAALTGSGGAQEGRG